MFVFAYAKIRFSHDEAHISPLICDKVKLSHVLTKLFPMNLFFFVSSVALPPQLTAEVMSGWSVNILITQCPCKLKCLTSTQCTSFHQKQPTALLKSVVERERMAVENISDRSQSKNMSLIMRKPAFCICENKAADQLRSDCTADQRFCFPYMDSTIPLLSKSKISCL